MSLYDSYESLMTHINLWLVCVYEEKKCGARNKQIGGAGQEVFLNKFIINVEPTHI